MRIIRLSIVATLLMALSICAASQQKASPEASKEIPSAPSATVNEASAVSFVRSLFGYNPEVEYKLVSIKPASVPGFSEVLVSLTVPQGQQAFKFLVTPDGQHAFVGDITTMPFGPDPFAPAREALQARADGPSRGPKDAKVKVVEFADLQCPSCKVAQPTLQRLASEKPEVQIVFQNFPIAAIHPWARRGAQYVDCLGRVSPELGAKFVDTVFEHQEEINPANADEKLKGFAGQVGADPQKTAACIADPKTGERIDASFKLGEELGVTGTPTVFINGRRVANFATIPYEVVRQLVDFSQQQAK